MNKLLTYGLGAAAVVVLLVVGAQVVGSNGLFGAEPTPTAQPSEPPSPIATPVSDPEGDLAPGNYVFHPLPSPNETLSVALAVPDGWTEFGGSLLSTDDPGTAGAQVGAIQFIDVTTLNGDPCEWSGMADDVSVGPTVDDLVEALLAQTSYEVSDPVDVTIGGHDGRRVDITYPTGPFSGDSSYAPDCDEGQFRLWSTSAQGPGSIHAQGPDDRWQATILDVEGTRLIIIAQDVASTLPAERAEMDSMIDSLVIEP